MSGADAERTAIRTPAMVKADFVTGLALTAFGAAVVWLSWAMPRFEAQDVEPLSVPGVVPGLLGALFVLMGAVLTVRSARLGGHRLAFSADRVRGLAARPATRRFLAALALCLLYPLLLIGHLPYAWATGLFVAAFILAFEWRGALPLRGRGRLLLTSAVQAAGVAAVVTYVFETLFLVALP